MSDSLRPHESQHARPPCPSPTPGVHSNLHPLSRWCHPAISSSSVVPFSSCPQSLPASESFPMSQLFAWGGQSTAVSALASFLPKNTQDRSPLEWTGYDNLECIKRQKSVRSKLWFSQWSCMEHKEGWCFRNVVLKIIESPLESKEIKPIFGKSTQNIHWQDWCWSWSSNTLATWCKGLTHWKRPWCWERLMAGGEEGNRGLDGWMAIPTPWTWVWANSRR